MTTNAKRIGLYAIVGVTIAVIVIAAIFVSGIQFPGGPKALGTLRVSITDAPVELKNLNVTIDGLFVNNVNNVDEGWTELNFTEGTPEVYFNLLALNNVTRDLSIAHLPAGNYSKIRLNVKAANATFTDDTTADLRVPPGHVDIIIHFEIKAGEETNLVIDMQSDKVAISNSLNLNPTFKATVE
jgi:hypothetical protein